MRAIDQIRLGRRAKGLVRMAEDALQKLAAHAFALQRGRGDGVPLLAVIFGVLRGIVNALLRKKGLSTDSRDYASSQHPYP